MTRISASIPSSANDSASSSWPLQALETELRTLVEAQKLREIDLQLGRQILAYESRSGSLHNSQADVNEGAGGATADAQAGVFLASSLVSLVLGRGQVCLPLTHCPVPELAHRWLSTSQWVERLRQCRCVWVNSTDTASEQPAQPWQSQPLVLECGPGLKTPRLYLARYYFYQAQVADSIQQRLSHPARQSDPTDVSQTLADLFPASSDGEINWQLVAAATACLQPVCVITGGPGTGKTTTVTRLLTALLSLQPGLRIALAAPTGKAAARMMESIRQARQRDDVPETIRATMAGIPDESYTLHRLLGWTPTGFRYNAKHPLAWDCIVVDEASMVDLAMMHQLLQAMPRHARLILLGDKDQLASVEAGSVLADVCNAGADVGPSRAFANQLQTLTGYDLSACVRSDIGAIQNAVAELKVSHRFGADSGIGQLAKAVNTGQISRANSCFEQFPDVQCDWIDSNTPSKNTNLAPWHKGVLTGYRDYCRMLKSSVASNTRSDDNAVSESGIRSDTSAASTSAILEAFNRFRVLVATRKGSVGLETVNRDIERLLVQAGLLARDALQPGSWYLGRPVMITRNDYDLGLFNGDIGILVKTGSGQKRVAFMTVDGDVRYVLPSRLPSHETAFAMTVHKSQGSEFNRVQLLLPERWQGVVTRELIYTAITRSREHFYLMSGRECWQRGLGNRVERASGLRDALWKHV